MALGGYTAGLLARHLPGPAEVTLRGIVPVDQPLELATDDHHHVTLGAEPTLAVAAPAAVEVDAPAAPSLDEAEAASATYPGFERHPFPGCFGCGPDRHHGDGLRLFPGLLPGREVIATPWTPTDSSPEDDAVVPPEIVWAALDCPQLWALVLNAPGDSEESVVTAAMGVTIHAPVPVGVPQVVMAWPAGREGRSLFVGGAIVSPAGEVLASGTQRAVVVEGRGVPLGLDRW